MKEFQDLKDSIRTVPDYPVQGVQFRDITTLLQKPYLFKKMIDAMTRQWAPYQIDAILSIESRGFIMAGALAYNLNAAFIPLRKPQKLPFKTYSVSYELEYGATDMHIHTDALDGHSNLRFNEHVTFKNVSVYRIESDQVVPFIPYGEALIGIIKSVKHGDH